MKTIKNYWTQLTIFILILSGLWIWGSKTSPNNTTSGALPAPQVGFQAPDFTLTTLDNESISLSDLRGKAIILNFWATWCPPCRSEMPAMQKVYTANSKEDFIILAVNNTQQDRIDDIEAFVLNQGLTFPILLDKNADVSENYQVHLMPTTFFINPEGRIDEIVIGGPMAEALLRTRANNLLGEGN